MRQTADREKKEEADLTATMGKVDKEVGGQGIRLGCPVGAPALSLRRLGLPLVWVPAAAGPAPSAHALWSCRSM